MKTLVTGAGGFIGRHLVDHLLATTRGEIVALDIVPPPAPHPDPRVRHLTGDVADAAVLQAALGGVDRIFWLGATLTSEAETNHARGLEVNLLGTLRLLDACRALPQAPRLVFTSSIAAFGGTLPETVDDDVPRTPTTSYGTQKAVNELLIDDATRRGTVDGRSLRLPIVLVRPASPGAPPAISDRIAALVREPLAGRDTTCPVAPDTRMPVASVHAVARALARLADLDGAAIGWPRAFNLPSLSVRADELVAAAKAAGATGNVTYAPEPAVQAVVDGWPRRFDSTRARALGITGDTSLDEIVRQR